MTSQDEEKIRAIIFINGGQLSSNIYWENVFLAFFFVYILFILEIKAKCFY